MANILSKSVTASSLKAKSSGILSVFYKTIDSLQEVVKSAKVFVGVSNNASEKDIARVLQIIEKKGKEAVFWSTSKSPIVNYDILSKCHELIIVTPEGFCNGGYVGKGLDEMIRTARDNCIRIRVLVENKLRKLRSLVSNYKETGSYVNYSLLFVL